MDESVFHQFTNIDDGDKAYIKEIRSVYAYDPESGTYLCELVPSYDLRYLHTYIVFTDELEKQKLSDELRDILDEKYCHQDSEDMYMHVSDIRALKDPAPKECGEFDTLEDGCEYLNSNWPF